jgi:hypothetical protein
MTEAEWLTCGDPSSMMDFRWVRENGYAAHWWDTFWQPATERRLRLFVVACCSRIWRLIPEGLQREAVLAAERMADGLASTSELAEVEERLREDDDRAQARVSALYASNRWEGRRHDRYDQIRPETVARYALAKRADLFQAVARGAAVLEAGADEAFDLGEPFEMGDRIGSIAGLSDEQIAVRRVDWERRYAAERAAQAALLRCIFGNPFRPVAVDPAWLTPTVVQLAQGIYDDRAFDRLPILADALQDAGCDNDDVLNHCRDDGPHARGCWVVDLVLGKS